MRNPLRGMRDWFRRKPRITRIRPIPTKYTIFFTVGGKKYYLVWDAWVQADDGTWELLDQAQMSYAVEYWIKDNSYAHVSRSSGDISVIRTASIDEFEVIDNSTFRNDIK